jgi:hypothetical protein
MSEATRLKMWLRGHLQWHYLPTKFHENAPIGLKANSGIHTQASDLISLLSFLESRLKMKASNPLHLQRESEMLRCCTNFQRYHLPVLTLASVICGKFLRKKRKRREKECFSQVIFF